MSADHKVAPALKDVLHRIETARQHGSRSNKVRLVAVSKTKPKEMVQEAYDAGQRDFGENYVQELTEKAPELPQDIRWHFIGHLQSNKAKALLDGVPNLAAVETVDSEKLANKLNNAVNNLDRDPLAVFVQINSSGEESKFGVEPADCVQLARHVHTQCNQLRLQGLMTIGMADYHSRPENFKCMTDCRQKVCEELGLQEDAVELSMGMSNDFEEAVQYGSTNVRVGSTIFGARAYTGSKAKDENERETQQAEHA
eukprot:jgi/Astpho2/3760/fgenesh1_pm.00060_%23_21_t